VRCAQEFHERLERGSRLTSLRVVQIEAVDGRRGPPLEHGDEASRSQIGRYVGQGGLKDAGSRKCRVTRVRWWELIFANF
jgi:hypothetical protein